MVEQKPSTGRIVHYVPQVRGEPSCLAAIVTGLSEDAAGKGFIYLTVFPLGQDPIAKGLVLHDEGRSMASWHWPERVDP